MEKKLLTLDDVQNNPMVTAFIRRANENLRAIGFTEHGFRHADFVAHTAYRILSEMGYPEREAELAAIAGLLHDIGNMVDRSHHFYSGAMIAIMLLKDMGMDGAEIAEIAAAIGNHDEINGNPVSNISSAIILADKADVHRTRVRNRNFCNFDIHDRVNYAVVNASLELEPGKQMDYTSYRRTADVIDDTNLYTEPSERMITLKLKIDTGISQVMEYFEIFLSRMVLCRRAAAFLSSRFALVINDVQLM
ncbi:MAG TPA: HD domain-containing protein [Firmicutes bacterium]|jgi:exopolyphosphatase/pppGpp-phosphohydrolase|nr:HD domain-containing protein [Bacillota bacterium]